MQSNYLQKPKALLVDLDGTLIDSVPMLYEAYIGFLKNHGIMGTPHEFQSLIGPSLSEIVEKLKTRYHLPEDTSALLDLYQIGLEEAYEQKVHIFPQALEVLHYVKKQGIKLALVSSAEKPLIKAFIKGAKLAALFDAIVPSRPGIPSKPHPDLYIKALQLLQISSDSALAIEDSLNGVKASTGAGIFTLWIKHNTLTESTTTNTISLSKGIYRQVNDWKDILILLTGLCDA